MPPEAPTGRSDLPSTLLTGTTEYSPLVSGSAYVTRSIIAGEITVAGSKALEIQHQCTTTHASNGLGNAANFTTEVYTVAIFQKH